MDFCFTCTVNNAFDYFTLSFAKDAFYILGKGVVILAFSIMFMMLLYRYSIKLLFKQIGNISDGIAPLLRIIIVSSILQSAGIFFFRFYEALIQWSISAGMTLIENGVDGELVIPEMAQTPFSKLVASAEGAIWTFVNFGLDALKTPTASQGLDILFNTGSNLIFGGLFAIVVSFVYMGLLIYFSYLILRSKIYLLSGLIFGPLAVISVCSKSTQATFFNWLRMNLAAALQIVGAGLSMGISLRFLKTSAEMMQCYNNTKNVTECGTNINQFVSMFGGDASQIEGLLNSLEIYMLLIFLGVMSWVIHYCFATYVGQFMQTSDGAGPMALFAAATAGLMPLGVRQTNRVTSNIKSSLRRTLGRRSKRTKDSPLDSGPKTNDKNHSPLDE